MASSNMKVSVQLGLVKENPVLENVKNYLLKLHFQLIQNAAQEKLYKYKSIQNKTNPFLKNIFIEKFLFNLKLI